MRHIFCRLLPLFGALVGVPPALALIDVPTANQRALDVADLASGSGVEAPVDTASLPLGDGAYLRAYRALAARGLVDPIGERLEAEAQARSDGKLHPEFLRPDLELRAYGLGGADERLLYHSGGETLKRGVNSFLTASGAAFWGAHLGGEYAFEFREGPDGWAAGTKRLYVKAQAEKWSLKVGRDSIRLGPGYHGSLLLDDNTVPLDQWMLRTEEPLFLPGVLSGLGGFRFMMFNAWLKDENPRPADPRYGDGVRTVEDPELWGMRLSYHPTLWLDVGLTRTVLYGGRGRHKYRSPGDWWKLVTAVDENVDTGGDHEFDNDQYAAVDVTVRLPFLNGIGPLRAGKIYWEHGGTDVRARWQGDDTRFVALGVLSDLAGIHLSTGQTELRFEYARTSGEWYNHSEYPQGYTYRGNPLGHHLGPDGREFFAQVSHYLGPEWRLVVDVDLEERGRSLEVPEKRNEAGVSLESYRLRALGVALTGKLELRAARVRDALDDSDRQDRTERYAGLRLEMPL